MFTLLDSHFGFLVNIYTSLNATLEHLFPTMVNFHFKNLVKLRLQNSIQRHVTPETVFKTNKQYNIHVYV